MPVHELEPSVADVPHKGMGYPGKERMGWVRRACQPHHILIVIAGDIHGVHAGETIQESPAPGDNVVEWISKQFEKIADDNQLPSLVFDVPEEGVEKRLAIGPAQVIPWGSVPDVQIADDKDRFVLVDTNTLSYFTGWLGLPALLYACISALHVKPAFGLC